MAKRKTSSDYCGPTPAQQREWRAQDDLRILRQAEEIRADKSRVNMAARIATKEMKALERVAGKAVPKGKR
jgi:hypothetical protein